MSTQENTRSDRAGHFGIVVSVLFICFGLLSPAAGQALNAGQGLSSSQSVSTPPARQAATNEPPLPAPESLFPGLFGLRLWLDDHGIAVLFDTINEFAGNISGGGGPVPAATGKTSGGASNDGQYGFETDINWEKLAGITGFSTNTIVVGRYGGVPASNLVGDTVNDTQEIYGAGGNVVVHLVQFFGTETLAGGRVAINAGRIPLDDFFSSSPLYCNYQQGAICGVPKGFSDNISHSAYPEANWAIRIIVRPTASVYVQTGIWFSNSNIYSNNGFRTGFNFDAATISGEAFPFEIGYEPALGAQRLPGHYKLGFVYDHNPHTNNYFATNGSPYAQSGITPRSQNGSTSAYAEFDQMVSRNGPGPSAGLIVLGGYLHNDPTTSYRADQVYAGVQDAGFWNTRPLDQIDALFSYERIARYVGKTQAIQIEEGLPSTEVLDGASGIQTWTINIEVNYIVHVFRGVTFAPSFQYYKRPNAQNNLPNAAFLGFKSHIEFF